MKSTRFVMAMIAMITEFGITIACLFTSHDLSGLAQTFTAINVGVLSYILGRSWRASRANNPS